MRFPLVTTPYFALVLTMTFSAFSAHSAVRTFLFIPAVPDPTKSLTFRLHGNKVPFVKPCGEMTERPKVLAC
jgi:hypothetical protein